MNENKMRMRTRKTNPKKRVLTQYKLDHKLKEARENLQDEFYKMSVCAASMVLHDDFNFDAEDLNSFTEKLVTKLNDFDAGYYSADDAAKWLDDYAGIKFRKVD